MNQTEVTASSGLFQQNPPAGDIGIPNSPVHDRLLGSRRLEPVNGSKIKPVNTRDKDFTPVTLKEQIEQVADHIAGYLPDLDTADLHKGEAAEAHSANLKDKSESLRPQMQVLRAMETQGGPRPTPGLADGP